MDDIQKTIENCYDAIRKAEEPTCSVCHAPIGLFCYSKQSRIPHGLKLDIMHEFGCQKCGRLGRGGTPYLAIVDYVKRYEINE